MTAVTPRDPDDLAQPDPARPSGAGRPLPEADAPPQADQGRDRNAKDDISKAPESGDKPDAAGSR